MIEFIFPLLLSNLVDYSIRHDFPAQIKCSFVNNSMNSKSIKDLNKVMLEVCQTDITFNDRIHSIDQAVCVLRCTFNSLFSVKYNGGAILVFLIQMYLEIQQ